MSTEEPKKKPLSLERALPPSQVIKQYGGLNGGPVHAREIIALSLREGTIRARAAKRWESSEETLHAAWKTEPETETPLRQIRITKEHKVPRAVWRKSVCWHDDVAGWDFRTGRLYVTTSLHPTRRILMRRVRLNSADVKKVMVPGSLSLGAGSFSNLKSLEQWRIFWHELFLLATNNGDLAKQSRLATITSDQKVLAEIDSILSKEYGFWQDNPNTVDEEIASIVASRSVLSLADSTVLDEIKALRQTLKLKRAYKTAKSKPAT
ncbi:MULTISPECIES: hypothetical protein [Sphingomonas]|uniref:hypothetical protein n=1 Tax=Sphingomonas TaxID=13687 RepID=UPI000F7FA1CC|nr:hypothetical protein [Sphingomonas sp. ABOLF]GLK20533.1 hypothetical protein GCM10017606_13590 [Microbacterium terregens]